MEPEKDRADMAKTVQKHAKVSKGGKDNYTKSDFYVICACQMRTVQKIAEFDQDKTYVWILRTSVNSRLGVFQAEAPFFPT